jgi:hypothetical protein
VNTHGGVRIEKAPARGRSFYRFTASKVKLLRQVARHGGEFAKMKILCNYL